MSIYSTLANVYALGEQDGLQRGIPEGACQQLGKLLLRTTRRLFALPSEEERGRLDVLVDRAGLAGLEQMRDRLPDATSWAALLAGIEAPAARPAEPDYLVPIDPDFSTLPPSI